MSLQLSRSDLEKAPWFSAQDYPFESRFASLAHGRMHYVDEGQGLPVVFVHGTPSWSYEFREHIRELRKFYRCIAPDHLGFGLSERPTNATYTVDFHRRNFAEWIAELGLERFSLVVHDFGGPIALPLAMREPDRIEKLVIVNSWFWPFEEVNPAFAKTKKWIDSSLMRFLYLRMNFSAQMLVRMAWGNHRPLDRRTHDSYRKMFPNARSRKSTWALAQAIARPQDIFSESEAGLAQLRKIPTLLIWGAQDRWVDLRNLDRWRSALPDAQELVLPKAGHFPMDEAHDAVLPRLKEFLSR